MHTKSYRLSQLFHYNPSTKVYRDLKKGLEEYKFLLWAARSAFVHLENGDYEKFDSLVGENACQIRAIKVALIALEHKQGDVDQILTHIHRAQEKIDKILESQINILMRKGSSLKEVVEQEKLDIALTDNEMTLIEAFLLSEMKESFSDGEVLPSILRKERCSPKEIKNRYPEISYSFVEKLAKRLRVHLAHTSVDFVRKMARELNDPLLMKMVGKDFEKVHNNLACTPTFWTFKTLFKSLQNKEVPLLFHVKFLSAVEEGLKVVDEEFIYCKSEHNAYVEVNPEGENLETPACIIQGAIMVEPDEQPDKSLWKEGMRKFSVLDILLCIGADHRQYPDPDQTVEVLDPEYRMYKLMAAWKGFSLSNPSRFFVQHIYCSQPTKLVSRAISLAAP